MMVTPEIVGKYSVMGPVCLCVCVSVVFHSHHSHALLSCSHFSQGD